MTEGNLKRPFNTKGQTHVLERPRKYSVSFSTVIEDLMQETHSPGSTHVKLGGAHVPAHWPSTQAVCALLLSQSISSKVRCGEDTWGKLPVHTCVPRHVKEAHAGCQPKTTRRAPVFAPFWTYPQVSTSRPFQTRYVSSEHI